MKHENTGKPWIRQSFFRQCFKITISPKIFTAKVLFYTVIQYFDCLEENEIPAVVRRLKQSNGEGVVFLIDGLDEYLDALQNCFLTCLIDRKILSKCVLVISSRPCASLSLHSKGTKNRDFRLW